MLACLRRAVGLGRASCAAGTVGAHRQGGGGGMCVVNLIEDSLCKYSSGNEKAVGCIAGEDGWSYLVR